MSSPPGNRAYGLRKDIWRLARDEVSYSMQQAAFIVPGKVPLLVFRRDGQIVTIFRTLEHDGVDRDHRRSRQLSLWQSVS